MATNPEPAERVGFVSHLLEQGQYDIVGTQCNYRPDGLSARLAWIRTFTQKPVWCSDMAVGPLLRGQLFDPPYTPEKIPAVLGTYLTDKLEAAKTAGYERVSLQFIMGCAFNGTAAWAYSCLLMNDGTTTPTFEALAAYCADGC